MRSFLCVIVALLVGMRVLFRVVWAVLSMTNARNAGRMRVVPIAVFVSSVAIHIQIDIVRSLIPRQHGARSGRSDQAHENKKNQ